MQDHPNMTIGMTEDDADNSWAFVQMATEDHSSFSEPRRYDKFDELARHLRNDEKLFARGLISERVLNNKVHDLLVEFDLAERYVEAILTEIRDGKDARIELHHGA